MNLITVTCLRCPAQIEIPSHLIHIGGICEKCAAADDLERRVAAAGNSRDAYWDKICPPAYRDTVFERLPYPERTQAALLWPMTVNAADQPLRKGIGLNLWGFPRTGKTRTLYLLLKREHQKGVHVKAFGPSGFKDFLEVHDYRTHWINVLAQIGIVAFDDIDKCTMTKVQEEKFFALLDARIRNYRPTFFTGNTQGDQLKTRFRNGEAIVSRMRESCISVYFPQQKEMIL